MCRFSCSYHESALACSFVVNTMARTLVSPIVGLVAMIIAIVALIFQTGMCLIASCKKDHKEMKNRIVSIKEVAKSLLLAFLRIFIITYPLRILWELRRYNLLCISDRWKDKIELLPFN